MVDKDRLNALRIERTTAASPVRRGVLIAVALLVIIAALAAILLTRRSAIPVVQVAAAQAGGGGNPAGGAVLNATGYVTARRQATVSSKVTGRVIEILVEEGMPVRQGQLLARLDAATPDAELRLAEARVESSRRALEETVVRIREARLELGRAQSLAQQQIGTQADADRARAEVQALEARLEAQRADLAVASRQSDLTRQNRDDTRIVAPFDGIVISKNAQAGEMISPMSSGGFTRTGICTIVDMDSLEIEVDVSESYINRVRAGQPVQASLDAYPDWSIPAHVIAVVPAADRQKATVRVRIGLDVKDPRILPDMGAKVAFMEDQAAPGGGAGSETQIPRSALVRDGEQDVVFLYDDGIAERRAVRVVATVGEQTRIAAGVRSGERVILSPPAELSDGDRVRLAEKE